MATTSTHRYLPLFLILLLGTCSISAPFPGDKKYYVCGSSYSKAFNCQENYPKCPSGEDRECCPNEGAERCSNGLRCYNHVYCNTPFHQATQQRNPTRYCGFNWDDANTKCQKSCPFGLDLECPGGQKCFDFTNCR